ncbi:hypothetical protein [Clostridium homopropionicum]|nr:hypothetical protein [Clostridium homopropionicum]
MSILCSFSINSLAQTTNEDIGDTITVGNITAHKIDPSQLPAGIQPLKVDSIKEFEKILADADKMVKENNAKVSKIKEDRLSKNSIESNASNNTISALTASNGI